MEAREAGITPLPYMQEVLDTALAQASDDAKTRFTAAIRADVPQCETEQPSEPPLRGGMLPVVVNGHLVFVPFDADALACSLRVINKKILEMPGAAAVGQLVAHAGVESWERIASAIRKPSCVDPITVELLKLVTETHRNLYHHLSSIELIPAVTGHFQLVTLLLEGAQCLPLHRRLSAIAGETAGHAAWLFHDLGDSHSAAHYYDVAGVALRDAGDPALDAYVRSFQSLMKGNLGQAREALGLVQRAVEAGEHSATATTRAWLLTVEAQALASVGDTQSCLAALRRAGIALGQGRREEDPAWMYEFDHARLLAASGACYGKLGKIEDAEQTLREALEAIGSKHTRRRAEVLVDLARVRARQQDAEEAAGLASESLGIAVETRSRTGILRVQRFRSELARWDGTRAVTSLDEQLINAV